MSKNKLRSRLGQRRSTRQMYTSQRVDVPIPLESIRLDGGTQPRTRFDEETLAEYSGRMKVDDRGLVVDPQNHEWDPLVVYEDDDGHRWLADGFHRVRAARSLDIESFQARVLPGSLRDAIRYSLSANARHGLRRTNEDKRRAVNRALADDEWGAYSARALAELCAVSDYMVRQLRQELEASGRIEQRDHYIGADGEVHDVSTRRSEPEEPAPRVTRGASQASPRALTLATPRELVRQLEARALELGALDSHRPEAPSACVIAYARTPVHFDTLGDHLEAVVAEGGSLIVPLERHRAAFSGIVRLDRLVERGVLGEPHWVILEDTRELVVVWRRGLEPLGEWFASLGALVEHLGPDSAAVLTPPQ